MNYLEKQKKFSEEVAKMCSQFANRFPKLETIQSLQDTEDSLLKKQLFHAQMKQLIGELETMNGEIMQQYGIYVKNSDFENAYNLIRCYRDTVVGTYIKTINIPINTEEDE